MPPYYHGELVTDEDDELLPPEPDEVEEERRPFSYVNFRVPPLIRCTELTLFPAVKTTSRSPSLMVGPAQRTGGGLYLGVAKHLVLQDTNFVL